MWRGGKCCDSEEGEGGNERKRKNDHRRLFFVCLFHQHTQQHLAQIATKLRQTEGREPSISAPQERSERSRRKWWGKRCRNNLASVSVSQHPTENKLPTDCPAEKKLPTFLDPISSCVKRAYPSTKRRTLVGGRSGPFEFPSHRGT